MVDLTSAFEWSGFRMVFTSLDHFIYKKQSRLVHTIRKPDLKNVRFSNESGFGMIGFQIPTVLEMSSHKTVQTCSVVTWSGFQMPFENQTARSFENDQIAAVLNGWFQNQTLKNVFSIWMFGIWIPTALNLSYQIWNICVLTSYWWGLLRLGYNNLWKLVSLINDPKMQELMQR